MCILCFFLIWPRSSSIIRPGCFHLCDPTYRSGMFFDKNESMSCMLKINSCLELVNSGSRGVDAAALTLLSGPDWLNYFLREQVTPLKAYFSSPDGLWHLAPTGSLELWLAIWSASGQDIWLVCFGVAGQEVHTIAVHVLRSLWFVA